MRVVVNLFAAKNEPVKWSDLSDGSGTLSMYDGEGTRVAVIFLESRASAVEFAERILQEIQDADCADLAKGPPEIATAAE